MQFVDNETKALLEAGFVRPIDLAIFLLEVLGLVVVVTWLTVGSPTVLNITLLLAALVFLKLTWILSVAYRACYFILKARASIETMPEVAGAIAQKRMLQVTSAGKMASPTE